MLKVLVCCMGGFSSSAMIRTLKQNIIDTGYSDKMAVEFHGFSTCYEVMNDYDIIMTCPHLKYSVPEFIQKHDPAMPIYVLPPKVYGSMTAEIIYEDACDILEEYKKNPKNPFCFEGEENNLRIKRRCSHRQWINGEGK